MIKAVIFDMDGVIIDSEPVYTQWLRAFLQQENVWASEKEIRDMAGISSQSYAKLLQLWWKRAGKRMTPKRNIYKEFNTYCEAQVLSYLNIKTPSIEDVMAQLKEKGIQIAVASSSPMGDIEKVLKETGLTSYVTIKVSGTDFAESKPNPEIYNQAVLMLGVKKEECLAVEDSTYGIQAARNAGITVAAKKDDRFGFEQSIADYIVEDLREVANIVLKRNEDIL